MKKLLSVSILLALSGCLGAGEFPREAHFKDNKLFGCQFEQSARELTLEIQRGHVQEAQAQLDKKIISGDCRLFYKNETLLLQEYRKGYFRFTPKGTDATAKYSYWASGQLINSY